MIQQNGIDDAPVFVRSKSRAGNEYWTEIDPTIQAPECHPHDRAWIISILHGLTTKSLGQIFEPPKFKFGEQQRKVVSAKYEKFYISSIESDGEIAGIQKARTEANTRLRKVVSNFENR